MGQHPPCANVVTRVGLLAGYVSIQLGLSPFHHFLNLVLLLTFFKKTMQLKQKIFECYGF